MLENYATLRGRPRWPTLKRHEAGLPDDARALLAEAGERVEITRMPRALGALMLAGLALPVVAGALANVPPLLAGWWAGRRFADDTNVITLWRVLVGVFVWWLWMALVFGATALCGVVLPLAYAGATLLGLLAYAPARNLALALFNPRHTRLVELAR